MLKFLILCLLQVIKHKVLENIIPGIELTMVEFRVHGMTCSGYEG